MDNFSFLISITVPNLLKKPFTFLSGGQIGIGPNLLDIGGSGMALTILFFLPIYFLSCERFMVEIKLTIFWFCLKLSLLKIFFPTWGVIAKKTQPDLFINCWLSFAIVTFLNLLLSFFAIVLLRGDI